MSKIKVEKIPYDVLYIGNEVYVKVIEHWKLEEKECYTQYYFVKGIIRQNVLEGDKFVIVMLTEKGNEGNTLWVSWNEGELIFEQDKEIPTVEDEQ